MPFDPLLISCFTLYEAGGIPRRRGFQLVRTPQGVPAVFFFSMIIFYDVILIVAFQLACIKDAGEQAAFRNR